MKIQRSKVLSICVASMVLLNTVPAFAATQEISNEKNLSSFSANIFNPLLRMESSGSLKDVSKFEETHHLTSKNGDNVNFWIDNKGIADIRITINGKEGRTFAPGESGHISTKVSFLTSKYVFKATLPKGGKITMDYSIAQR